MPSAIRGHRRRAIRNASWFGGQSRPPRKTTVWDTSICPIGGSVTSMNRAPGTPFSRYISASSIS
jgi:hypothetical protein